MDTPNPTGPVQGKAERRLNRWQFTIPEHDECELLLPDGHRLRLEWKQGELQVNVGFNKLTISPNAANEFRMKVGD